MSDVRTKPPASRTRNAADRIGETSLSYSTHPDDPQFADEKWSAWKVTVFVVGVCGAFWTGLVYLLMSLFA